MTLFLILELEMTEAVMISYLPLSSASSSSCGSVGKLRGMVEVEGPTRRCFLEDGVPSSVVRSTTSVGVDCEEDLGMVSNSAWSRLRRTLVSGLAAARDETADGPGIAAIMGFRIGVGSLELASEFSEYPFLAGWTRVNVRDYNISFGNWQQQVEDRISRA